MSSFNKIKYPILGALLPLVLTSCDPLVEYQQVVQNNSEYNIWLVIHDSYPHDEVYVDNYEQDSFYLPAHTEVVLYDVSRIGKPGEYSNCDLYADSITARIDGYDSLSVVHNINDTYAWVFTEYERQKGKCECRFTIGSEDIQ